MSLCYGIWVKEGETEALLGKEEMRAATEPTLTIYVKIMSLK